MPSTTPDLRTVTWVGSSLRSAGGERSAPAAAGLGSAKVDGVLPARRGSATPALRERSGFGQASSNDAGGGSADSGTGGVVAVSGWESAAEGSVVRASARSRSFRDDDENSRLRRALTAAAASAPAGASAPSSCARSRGAASPCQGGGDGAAAGAAASASPASSDPGRPRLNRLRGAARAGDDCNGISALDSAAASAPSRRAIFFNSLTAIQRPISSIPVQAAIVPATIRVLPKPNSLIGIPNPIATRPANRKPIPVTNNRTTIELTPQPAPKMRASP